MQLTENTPRLRNLSKVAFSKAVVARARNKQNQDVGIFMRSGLVAHREI